MYEHCNNRMCSHCPCLGCSLFDADRARVSQVFVPNGQTLNIKANIQIFTLCPIAGAFGQTDVNCHKLYKALLASVAPFLYRGES